MVRWPSVSDLSNYRLDSFSVERLLHFLNALNSDVEVVVRKKPHLRKTGQARLMAN
jgi:predicted XRE-type DNA-binding protein